MPRKRVYSEPQCEVLLVVDKKEMKGKPSTKGLNWVYIRVVRWFGGKPCLERRHMFLDDATGDLKPLKNLGWYAEDLAIIKAKAAEIDKAMGVKQ